MRLLHYGRKPRESFVTSKLDRDDTSYIVPACDGDPPHQMVTEEPYGHFEFCLVCRRTDRDIHAGALPCFVEQ